MKYVTTLLLTVLISSMNYGQENPYVIFGDSSEVLKSEFEKLRLSGFVLINDDSLSNVGHLTFNFESLYVEIWDRDSCLIGISALPPDVMTRWLSVDPLADKYPYVSPYNFVLNNPVYYIDKDGREPDDYVFSQSGYFIEIIKTDSPDRLAIETADGYTYYEFNDPSVDVMAINENIFSLGEEAFSSVKFIYTISDDDIAGYMSESDIHYRHSLTTLPLGSREWFAYSESNFGKMDFVWEHLHDEFGGPEGSLWTDNELKRDEGPLFLLGSDPSTAYNFFDAGNFLWGYSMNELGFSYEQAKAASLWFNEEDTDADQEAIKYGHAYASGGTEASSRAFQLDNSDEKTE